MIEAQGRRAPVPLFVLLDRLVQRATRAPVLLRPGLLCARDELVDRVRAVRVRDQQPVRPEGVCGEGVSAADVRVVVVPVFVCLQRRRYLRQLVDCTAAAFCIGHEVVQRAAGGQATGRRPGRGLPRALRPWEVDDLEEGFSSTGLCV